MRRRETQNTSAWILEQLYRKTRILSLTFVNFPPFYKKNFLFHTPALRSLQCSGRPRKGKNGRSRPYQIFYSDFTSYYYTQKQPEKGLPVNPGSPLSDCFWLLRLSFGFQRFNISLRNYCTHISDMIWHNFSSVMIFLPSADPVSGRLIMLFFKYF